MARGGFPGGMGNMNNLMKQAGVYWVRVCEEKPQICF